MKKIKIYIVTYRRSTVLNNTIGFLFDSDFSQVENTEVTIVNNHSEFSLDDRFKDKVRVLHNMTRPDFSTGNLGENWNKALINGFKNLNSPDAEIVVTVQNDVEFHLNWCSNLLKMHEKYTLITGENGDNIVSYKPEAVKRIGMWDERIPGIFHKEADYWIRAMILNKEKTCINDTLHKRFLNNEDYLKLHNEDRMKDAEANKYRVEGQYSWKLALKVFCHKWKDTWKTQPTFEGWIKNWSNDFVDNPPSAPKINTYMRYPYFEKDIEDLKGKNYVGI